MSGMVKRGEALPSLDKARRILERCVKIGECMKIKALAQAVASVESVEAARNEAAAIVLLAKARVGELTKELEKAPPGKRRGSEFLKVTQKKHALKAEGLSKKEAAECEKLAALKKSGFLDKLIEKDSQVTLADALAVARALPDEQRAVLKKIVSGTKSQEATRQVKAEKARDAGKLPETKFRVVYADPPWDYGNTQPDYQTEQRDHYRTMKLSEICALPIKEMIEDDAVLFLWTTSPCLEESFDVINAWGFKYKASFVWDKIAHNMGHYNSVRHEFLLVCVRGSCQPDVRKLYDSVVSEQRTEHSRKPETFREIIDTIYPHGKRVELFRRGKAPKDWATWGNE